jgi:hypothetical protein
MQTVRKSEERKVCGVWVLLLLLLPVLCASGQEKKINRRRTHASSMLSRASDLLPLRANRTRIKSFTQTHHAHNVDGIPVALHSPASRPSDHSCRSSQLPLP